MAPLSISSTRRNIYSLFFVPYPSPILSPFNLSQLRKLEMEGSGCLSNFVRRTKPYIAMISLQFGYAGMNIITKVSLNTGMSHYVLVVYRHAFATAAIAPFAIIIERYYIYDMIIITYNCLNLFIYKLLFLIPLNFVLFLSQKSETKDDIPCVHANFRVGSSGASDRSKFILCGFEVHISNLFLCHEQHAPSNDIYHGSAF